MEYIVNSVSLNMLTEPGGKILLIDPCRKEDIDMKNVTVAIGHADLARLIGVEPNRVTLALEPGDVCYVAQYRGPRLPEGATELPENARIEWYKVRIDKEDRI